MCHTQMCFAVCSAPREPPAHPSCASGLVEGVCGCSASWADPGEAWPTAFATHQAGCSSYRCFQGTCTDCVLRSPWKGKNTRLLCWSLKPEKNICSVKMPRSASSGTTEGNGRGAHDSAKTTSSFHNDPVKEPHG